MRLMCTLQPDILYNYMYIAWVVHKSGSQVTAT